PAGHVLTTADKAARKPPYRRRQPPSEVTHRGVPDHQLVSLDEGEARRLLGRDLVRRRRAGAGEPTRLPRPVLRDRCARRGRGSRRGDPLGTRKLVAPPRAEGGEQVGHGADRAAPARRPEAPAGHLPRQPLDDGSRPVRRDRGAAGPRRADGPVIGAIGRLAPEKGYDLAIHALRDLPEATLVLVGDGSERERLEAIARELGVAERVQFTGWSDEPRRYLPGFDAFVLPSRQEGFPLAVVEAMLAGLPVVAADVGSVSEAVVDEETGYLVP